METLTKPEVIKETVSVSKWLLIYGFMGAFMACLLDSLQNDTAAVLLKIRTALSDMLDLPVHGGINVLFISLLGALACQLQRTNSPLDAFARGLAVFTFFNLVAPNNTPIKPNVNDITQETHGQVVSEGYTALLTSFQSIKPNAVIEETDEWISSTKPAYSGFLGIHSLFNNSMDISRRDYDLSRGQEVEVVCYWDTAMRGYRYVLIKYLARDGSLKCGWVYSGKEPNPWSFIKPKAGHEDKIKSYTDTESYPGTESCLN